jgi:hypothetical protein
VLALIALVVALVGAGAARAQDFRVVVVPGLDLADLEELAPRGAVGLLVPAAGPETSRRQALAALERGEVVNSLRGGLPSGPPLIRVDAGAIPAADTPTIVVGLPAGGEQPNDRRYPIVVIGEGFEGLLVSDSTRIPGLVSIVDVAPTALGRADGLGSRAAADPAGDVAELDGRIGATSGVRGWASLLTFLILAALVAVSGRIAVLGFATALAANLALGLAGLTSTWAVLLVMGLAVAVGSPLLGRVLRSPVALGIALVTVLAAYLVALAVDGPGVALSPLGPTQNSRFYGLSNLLSTMLLVPTLAGAALVAERWGLAGFAGVGALGFVTVASGSLGADGGGAIVLAVGLVVLAAEIRELSARAFALLLVTALALVGAVVALEAAAGVSSHVTTALEDGPGAWLSDLADRIEVSFRRTTAHPATEVAIVVGLAALVAMVWWTFRQPLRRSARALPLAFAAAVATSLVVNDSPLEVTLAGVVGYGALLRLVLDERQAGR